MCLQMMRSILFYDGSKCLRPTQDELGRMVLDHHIFGLLIGQLQLASLDSPQRILDLGTGTGH